MKDTSQATRTKRKARGWKFEKLLEIQSKSNLPQGYDTNTSRLSFIVVAVDDIVQLKVNKYHE
jgi:hypothetical protein